MKKFESEHYVFHFNEDSKAEQDIASIAACQESCFQNICGTLNVTPEFKIKYFLCDTPEEVGRFYGDNEPCNGFADPPNTVYAVYNESIQCIGFHEDAHLISYIINRPNCPAIREGLAMYFDRKWWRIQNMDWTSHYLKTGRYLSVNSLLDKEFFYSHEETITYPIMGAFTEWLISVYGIERFLEMYRKQDIEKALKQVYHKSAEELNFEFTSYISLFRIDEIIEQRMETMLSKAGV